MVTQPSTRSSHGRWLSAVAISMLPVLITAVLLLVDWPRIPHRFPIQWNISGQPNGWATRTVVSVFWPLAVAFVLTVLAASVGLLINRVTSPHQQHIIRRPLLLSTCFIVFAFTANSLITLLHGAMWSIPILNLTILFFAFGVSGLLHSQASTLRAEVTEQPVPFDPVGRTDPVHWTTLGIYSNSSDPAIWLPKRSGLGWTLNFAHTIAWVYLAAILIVPILLITLIELR